MREIYFRSPTDASYKDNIIETTDVVEMLVSQLKMILLTNRGMVLGDTDFGLDLESLIFDYDVGEDDLRASIDQQLYRYCPLFFQTSGYYEVTFFEGDFRDICVIEFYIPSIVDNTPIINLKIS
jgi:hypothetical protein